MHALLGGFTHTRIPVCMFASFTRITNDFAALIPTLTSPLNSIQIGPQSGGAEGLREACVCSIAGVG